MQVSNFRPQIRGSREAPERARLEPSEALRDADSGAWRALRERDLRLRARFEASEAPREPDLTHREAGLRLPEPDLRPQRRSESQI